MSDRWNHDATMPAAEGINRGGVEIIAEYGPLWRKKLFTAAVRMEGPFSVETREGPLSCPDGYLAVDSQGWPYPIARDEFEAIYEPVR